MQDYASSELFDDGEVHCRVYDPWLSYISKLWAKTLQYRHPYLDPYIKQIKAHLMLLCTPHVTKAGKLAKKLVNCYDLPNLPKFFPLQSFLLYNMFVCTYVCIYVCMHMYMYVHMYIFCVFMCTCIQYVCDYFNS